VTVCDNIRGGRIYNYHMIEYCNKWGRTISESAIVLPSGSAAVTGTFKMAVCDIIWFDIGTKTRGDPVVGGGCGT